MAFFFLGRPARGPLIIVGRAKKIFDEKTSHALPSLASIILDLAVVGSARHASYSDVSHVSITAVMAMME